MSDEVMVKVEGVSKKYCYNMKRSLRYGLHDLANELLLKKNHHEKLRPREFWALQDINFELKRGDSLGIIGVNGSGKTTMLMMLQGLIRPSMGKITIRGQVGALISLGAGFQPVLTGRENIYINAAVLGIPQREVNQKIEEIVEFADIGKFIDAPVRTYSSGMKTRLGFSVATNLVNPDVLLIDEVLAAGDLSFKQKCFQRMQEIVDSGATVILVAHSMRLVEKFCKRVIHLNKGTLIADGPASEVCQQYYSFINQQVVEDTQKKAKNKIGKAKKGVGGDHANIDLFEVTQVELLNQERRSQEQFSMLETLVVRVHFTAHEVLSGLVAIFKLQTLDGVYISSFSSQGQEEDQDRLGPGYVECVIPSLPLREGSYLVDVGFFEPSRGRLYSNDRGAMLSVIPDRTAYKEAWSSKGLVHIPTDWKFEQKDARSSSSDINSSSVV